MPLASQISPLPSRLQTLILKLHQKKYRYRFGQYIAEGLKTVQDSLRFGARPHFFVFRDGEILPPWSESAPVYVVPSSVLNKISSLDTPSGILAVFSLNTALVSEELRTASHILVLDGLSDPGNVGTLLRTAHWFGFRHVVMCGSAADPFNPKAVQAAMGSLPALQIYFLDTKEILGHLLNWRASVFLAVLEGGQPLSTIKDACTAPSVLVLGSESHGLSNAWMREEFNKIYIPPADLLPPDSLNVAMAGAILMHHFAGRIQNQEFSSFLHS